MSTHKVRGATLLAQELQEASHGCTRRGGDLVGARSAEGGPTGTGAVVGVPMDARDVRGGLIGAQSAGGNPTGPVGA